MRNLKVFFSNFLTERQKLLLPFQRKYMISEGTLNDTSCSSSDYDGQIKDYEERLKVMEAKLLEY